MAEIKLPSGNTAKLRDAKTMKQKDRAWVIADAKQDVDVAVGMSLMDKLIAVLVEEWSFDLIPPRVKIENLGELDIPDYDALFAEAEKVMPVLWPQLAKTVEAEADPKAPTDN